jgi:hypothetical protein
MRFSFCWRALATVAIGGLIVGCAHISLAQAPAQAPEAQAPAPTFSPAEQQARQAVLDSAAWKEERRRFDAWLSVQSLYSPEQVASMKQELAAQIARKSAVELQGFLQEMNQRLDVLLSPDAAAARAWADQFYTLKGRQELAAKEDMSDPMEMTPAQLSVALANFARDRQAGGQAQAAFQAGQAAQIAANTQREETQRAAAEAAASAPRQTFGPTAYAPKRENRPQRYVAPYDPPQFSIDPWGGVWWSF